MILRLSMISEGLSITCNQYRGRQPLYLLLDMLHSGQPRGIG
jgi:hypothetical protein